MHISRVVIKNLCSFELLDVPLLANTACVLGENNTGKSNLLYAIRCWRLAVRTRAGFSDLLALRDVGRAGCTTTLATPSKSSDL